MNHPASDRRPAQDRSTQFALQRLQQAITEAKRLGFLVRSEWLGGAAEGWCEIGGRRVLFVDLSLSVHEQLDQVESAIRAIETPHRKDQTTENGMMSLACGGFDFQITIDERRGHLFGEHIQRQHPFVLHVAQHLMPPTQNLGGGGLIELLRMGGWMIAKSNSW
ncbi:MAG: hypothetical protein R3C05_11025 [Pirellulaceae bacterium]